MKRNIDRIVPVIPTHSKNYGQDNRSMSILEQKALMRQWRIAAAKGNLLGQKSFLKSIFDFLNNCNLMTYFLKINP